MTITRKEVGWLESITNRLRGETESSRTMFVLPQGSWGGSSAHVLRTACNEIVRVIYCCDEQSHETDPVLYDFFHLLSGYFCVLAKKLNASESVDEIPYYSRNLI